jgi:hypothetical protein
VSGEISDEGAADVYAAARANLFLGALPHIANWENGRLEARSHVPWSSQALCISVWGAIAESERRLAILSDILRSAGVELAEAGATPGD